jgi:Tfp pilus assembly protein PilF
VPPQSPLARRSHALQLLASVSGKPPAEARRAVEQLIAANADDAGVLTPAAAYLTGSGANARAREVLERIMALDPDSTDARMLLATLDLRARDVANATRLLTEILKIDPKHKTARQGLSEIAWFKGDRVEARRRSGARSRPAEPGHRCRVRSQSGPGWGRQRPGSSRPDR